MADKKNIKINKALSDKIKIKAKISKIKIETPKGRPLLKWVGKAPLDHVEGHPTQLVEYYAPDKKTKILKVPEYDELEKNWHNLLFHGDNKEVLATLLELGFRGKVDLIYIDPPFASNKDYMRKVELRGLKDLGRIEEDSESIIQQTMYEDIWKRDEYFQFMYERLTLLKELLSEKGTLYLHLDYHVSHYLKVIMDEIFGQDNFRNEIVWCYTSPSGSVRDFPDKHQIILRYSKSDDYLFNKVNIPYKSGVHDTKGTALGYTGKGREVDVKTMEGSGKLIEDWWVDIWSADRYRDEYTGFRTQKPLALLERIITASSNPGDLILDCFLGSGTTCVAAQKLGRRWVGVDVNKGSIQLTGKRLQTLIKKQQKQLIDGQINKSYDIYKVNNYDLRILKTEAKELAIQQYGITRTKTETFFDGLRDSGELVKIIDFNHPLTLLDLQLVKDELGKRPDEDRDIVVISLGRETKVDSWVEEWNKKQPHKDARTSKRMRQFIIFDLKDKNFVSYEPSKADVEIKRVGKDKVKIKITSFISPTIIKRLELEPGLLRKKIPDFRSMIDVVLVDTDYSGGVFRIAYSDVPEKKKDLVRGEYEFEIPKKKTKAAVKIIDMLGEEALVIEKI